MRNFRHLMVFIARVSTILAPALAMAIATSAALAQPAFNVDPIEARIDVVAGATLVAPVRVIGTLPTTGVLAARLDDGRKVDALLRSVSVALDPAEHAAWLPPAARWAVDLKPKSSESVGATWVLVMQLPADAAGQSVWVGTTKLPLNWIPAPSALVRSTERFGWPAPLTATTLSPELRELLIPEAASPVRRWRYRLLTTGLDPRREAEVRLTGGESDFADPVLEALARQAEARWSVAIAWLWRDQEDLARRLARRLTLVVDFGDGHMAPAWPLDQADLDSLVSDLVDPDLSTSGRIARAETWLKAQEPALAWLTDDAGLSAADPGDDAQTINVSTARVVNLTDRAFTVSFGASGTKPDLQPIEPAVATRLACSMPTAAPDDARHDASVPLVLASGSWTVSLNALATRIPVRPPGRVFGGMLTDLSLRTWLSPSTAAGVSALPDTRAMISRGTPNAAWDDPSWFLMVECRRASRGDEDAAKDRVEVWIGPHAHPRAVLQLTGSGEASLIQGENPDAVRPIAERVKFVLEEARWVAIVPLDRSCIEPESVARIGLVRVDSRGVRGSWPRAMLPWQVEPSRVSFSLRDWGGLARE